MELPACTQARLGDANAPKLSGHRCRPRPPSTLNRLLHSRHPTGGGLSPLTPWSAAVRAALTVPIDRCNNI